MRILFVTPYFPAFAHDNYGEAVLYLAKNIINIKDVETIEIMTPVHIQKYDKRYYQFKVYSPEKPLGKIERIFFLIKEYKRLISQKKYNIINIQWIFPTGLILLFSSKLRNSKVVFTLRGSDVYLRYNNPVFRWLLKKIISKGDHVISISRDLDRKIIHLTHGSVTRSVIPSIGVDFQIFHHIDQKKLKTIRNKYNLSGKKVILFVGGITKIKGADILIKALVYLLNKYRYNNFTCILIGDGNLKSRLEKKIIHSTLENKVIFTGKLKYEVLKYYYKLADLFVLPSRTEGLGAVLLESLYFNLPVIASDTGGIKDLIIHKKNGFLVPVGDYRKIAEYIYKIFNDHIDLKNKNIIDIKKYNYRFMAEKTIKAYNKILD